MLSSNWPCFPVTFVTSNQLPFTGRMSSPFPSGFVPARRWEPGSRASRDWLMLVCQGGVVWSRYPKFMAMIWQNIGGNNGENENWRVFYDFSASFWFVSSKWVWFWLIAKYPQNQVETSCKIKKYWGYLEIYGIPYTLNQQHWQCAWLVSSRFFLPYREWWTWLIRWWLGCGETLNNDATKQACHTEKRFVNP